MSRYIDADALLYDIRIAKMLTFGILEAKHVEEIIEQQPTADVVPSRYGCGSAPYCSDVFEVDEDE